MGNTVKKMSPSSKEPPLSNEEVKSSPGRIEQLVFHKQHTYSQDNEDLFNRTRKEELIISEVLHENEEEEEDRSDIFS